VVVETAICRLTRAQRYCPDVESLWRRYVCLGGQQHLPSVTIVTLLLLTMIEALPNAGSCRWLPATAFARLATKSIYHV
jgi:hypothetical protein